MERPSFIDIHLERKEDATSLTLRHAWRSGETITQFNIIMPIVTCVIPAVQKDGVELDIPRSAWNDVEKVVKEEFGISLDVAFLELRDEDEETQAIVEWVHSLPDLTDEQMKGAVRMVGPRDRIVGIG